MSFQHPAFHKVPQQFPHSGWRTRPFIPASQNTSRAGSISGGHSRTKRCRMSSRIRSRRISSSSSMSRMCRPAVCCMYTTHDCRSKPVSSRTVHRDVVGRHPLYTALLQDREPAYPVEAKPLRRRPGHSSCGPRTMATGYQVSSTSPHGGRTACGSDSCRGTPPAVTRSVVGNARQFDEKRSGNQAVCERSPPWSSNVMLRWSYLSQDHRFP